MARTKDYSNHILLVKDEIQKTQAKLTKLNTELNSLMEEKDKHAVNTLYKYIRENKIHVADILHTMDKETVIPEIKNITETSVKNSTKKNKSVANSTRKKSTQTNKKKQNTKTTKSKS